MKADPNFSACQMWIFKKVDPANIAEGSITLIPCGDNPTYIIKHKSKDKGVICVCDRCLSFAMRCVGPDYQSISIKEYLHVDRGWSPINFAPFDTEVLIKGPDGCGGSFITNAIKIANPIRWVHPRTNERIDDPSWTPHMWRSIKVLEESETSV